MATFYKSAGSGLIHCKFLENTPCGGVRVRLLEDKGVYKKDEVICTIEEYVRKYNIAAIRRYCEDMRGKGYTCRYDSVMEMLGNSSDKWNIRYSDTEIAVAVRVLAESKYHG